MAVAEKLPIYLCDMNKCLPRSALSKVEGKDRWRMLTYECEAGKGVMLGSQGGKIPDIRYSLEQKGWYSIFLGILPHWSVLGSGSIRVKLEKDPCFITIRLGGQVNKEEFVIKEVYWKDADITSQSIIFREVHNIASPMSFLGSGSSNIAYVKLIPLPEKRIEEIRRNRENMDTKKLIAMNDGGFLSQITSEEEIVELPEALRDTDFKIFNLAVSYGDTCNYPTEVGFFGPEFKTNLDAISPDIVPFTLIMKHCRTVGLEFYAQFRLAFQMPYRYIGFDELPDHRFGLGGKNPNLTCIARDGTPLISLSYAYPEVQSHIIALIREGAEYGPDGINLCFTRGPIYVGYEKLVGDEFRQKYGDDPREIDEKDDRWLRHQAQYMTDFVRGVRQALDEVESKLKKRIRVAAMVYYNEEENLSHALDVRTWLKEQLIDEFLPVTKVHYMSPVKRIDIDFYKDITRGTSCKLYPTPSVIGDGYPISYHGKTDDFIERAIEWYKAGADGMSFWETPIFYEELRIGLEGPLKATYRPLWDVLRRLGHTDELEKLKELGPPRQVPLKTLNGYDVSQVFTESDVKLNVRLGAG